MKSGSIHLILGPMWAGKTSELIRKYRRYKVAGKRCLLIKYANDTRYDENLLCTHDQYKIEATACSELSQLNINIEDWDVICIDEIQFYPDNLSFCENMANSGIIVLASGLSGNYLREPFPNMDRLMAKADKLHFLTAICMLCKAESATFTKRISAETEEVVLGGTDKYLATCRRCYFYTDKSE